MNDVVDVVDLVLLDVVVDDGFGAAAQSAQFLTAAAAGAV